MHHDDGWWISKVHEATLQMSNFTYILRQCFDRRVFTISQANNTLTIQEHRPQINVWFEPSREFDFQREWWYISALWHNNGKWSWTSGGGSNMDTFFSDGACGDCATRDATQFWKTWHRHIYCECQNSHLFDIQLCVEPVVKQRNLLRSFADFGINSERCRPRGR